MYQKLQVTKAKNVVASDSVNVYYNTVGDNTGCVLYIGTGGDLKVKTASGDDVVFANLADGTFLPVQILRVFATGTTASNIISLW